MLAQNSALNLAAALIQQQQQQNTTRFPAQTGANFPQAQNLARGFPFESQPNTPLNWPYANNKNTSSTPSLRPTSPIQQLNSMGIDNFNLWSSLQNSHDVNHLVATSGCSLPNTPMQLINEQLSRGIFVIILKNSF